MMKHLSFVPSDHGWAGRERPGPRLRHPPSLLRSHQDGGGGVRLFVHQDIPEQNFPRLSGQEETQEERQNLVRDQPNPVTHAKKKNNTRHVPEDRERARQRRRRRDKSSDSSLFLCLLPALSPAGIRPIILLTHTALWTMGQVGHGAALLLLVQRGSTCRGPTSGYSDRKPPPSAHHPFSVSTTCTRTKKRLLDPL